MTHVVMGTMHCNDMRYYKSSHVDVDIVSMTNITAEAQHLKSDKRQIRTPYAIFPIPYMLTTNARICYLELTRLPMLIRSF